jgi:hypothetical protein
MCWNQKIQNEKEEEENVRLAIASMHSTQTVR